MNILLLVKERKKAGFGGVETLLKNISEEFKKRGHEIDIISRNDDLRLKNTIRSVFPMRKRIREIMRKKNYDVIYTQDWNMALPLLFPYPLYRKKHFTFFHATQQGKALPIQFVVGALMKKRLLTGDRANQKRYGAKLIATSVDMNRFKPLHKKRIYLGWTNKPSEVITKEKIKEIGKNLKIPVLIAENIPHDKMNEFYNKCKIYVCLPPKQAGGGVTYMEAMAAGIPRIVGNMYAEGYKFPFDKVEDFHGNLEEAIKNSKEKNYRKWMKDSKITWKRHSEELIKFFTKGKTNGEN
ncbi:MAG: glycosyltransferase [Nanoarchaeota archaeon]